MCGILGFVKTSFSREEGLNVLQCMADKLMHRGPDESGLWFDEQAQVALGHRRLSILDLSSSGSQPMLSPRERYVIVFNGEIYNHVALRQELGDFCVWRGSSDTETLLAGFDAWGIESTLNRTIGMFAFAVWDKYDQILVLARDRLGEKPLYYGWQQNIFLFGSELSALKAHPAFNAQIDRDALALLMRHSSIPAPYCIWKDIHKLMPGCMLTVSLKDMTSKIITYWSGKDVVESGSNNPFLGSSIEISSTLEALLSDAIRQQMVADVPIGAFLSGGVDSSLIVALMQQFSNEPVRTFSIGFREKNYNEAVYASAVAKHLQTSHLELLLSEDEALNIIQKIPQIYDEPFADSSQIPVFLVAQLAKQYVSVALSGDGGDELFAGYNRYLVANKLERIFSGCPSSFRRGLGMALKAMPPRGWDYFAQLYNNLKNSKLTRQSFGDKIHKTGSLLLLENLSDTYYQLVSHWDKPTDVVLGSREPKTVLTTAGLQPRTATHIEKMMALDLLSYLPDDILTKVDRAAMSVSLETRVPFLDHRVVEFAWSLPLNQKLNQGIGKWPLRQILYKYVPKELIERPKMGFAVPIDQWLRGSLREWAEALLDKQRISKEGYFDPQLVRHKWEQHLSGRYNWQSLLWNVLMFQVWLEAQT